MLKKVEIITFTKREGEQIEARTSVLVSSDGDAKASRCVGRGIDWTIEWRISDRFPRPEHITHEQVDEVSASVVAAIQRLKDEIQTTGGFTPRTDLSRPEVGYFDG